MQSAGGLRTNLRTVEVDTFWKTRRLRIAEAPSLWPIGRETVFRKFYQSISSFRIKSRLFIYLFRRQQNVGQEPLRSILLPRLVGIYAGQCVLSNDRGNKWHPIFRGVRFTLGCVPFTNPLVMTYFLKNFHADNKCLNERWLKRTDNEQYTFLSAFRGTGLQKSIWLRLYFVTTTLQPIQDSILSRLIQIFSILTFIVIPQVLHHRPDTLKMRSYPPWLQSRKVTKYQSQEVIISILFFF